MKRDEIIRYAEANGIDWEEHFPATNIATRTSSFTYFIGLELKPYVWYWWATLPMVPGDAMSDYLAFRQRYNMANGVKQSGYVRGYQAETIISDFNSQL